MSTNPRVDAEAAARLVSFGLRPKLLPARDEHYGSLVARYLTDDSFKGMVHAVAAGLDLLLLDVNKKVGTVLASTEESVFTIKMEEYARRAMSRDRKDIEKVLHGVIHLAIAALAYPRSDDLADDSYIGRVSVSLVDSTVRDACAALDKKSAEAEENQDPLEDAPQLERTWRAYARRPMTTSTKDNRAAADSTRGMIIKALKFLGEQGFFTLVNDEDGGTWRASSRYQIQVRELAAEQTFHDFLDLGVLASAGTSLIAASDNLTLGV
jgi:hypothetical protein